MWVQLDYMAPEVVSLPTADERKRMEQQGRPAVEQVYTEKVCARVCVCVCACAHGPVHTCARMPANACTSRMRGWFGVPLVATRSADDFQPRRPVPPPHTRRCLVPSPLDAPASPHCGTPGRTHSLFCPVPSPLTFAASASATSLTTSTSFTAVQRCPLNEKPPLRIDFAAKSRSASLPAETGDSVVATGAAGPKIV